MSAGRKKVLVRLGDELLAEVQEALAKRNARMGEAGYTLSDWIRQAIVEKLDKQRRGRKQPGCITPAAAYRRD